LYEYIWKMVNSLTFILSD